MWQGFRRGGVRGSCPLLRFARWREIPKRPAGLPCCQALSQPPTQITQGCRGVYIVARGEAGLPQSKFYVGDSKGDGNDRRLWLAFGDINTTDLDTQSEMNTW